MPHYFSEKCGVFASKCTRPTKNMVHPIFIEKPLFLLLFLLLFIYIPFLLLVRKVLKRRKE